MRPAALLLLCALPVAPVAAQDTTVEITDQALNRIVAQLGSPSDGGVFVPTANGSPDCVFFGSLDCPARADASPRTGSAVANGASERILLARCRSGDKWTTEPSAAPVAWQWWVTDARFHARAGALEFSAKVHTLVGGSYDRRAVSVSATVGFDPAGNRLRLNVQEFKVPLNLAFLGTTSQIAEVDVGKLFGLSLLLEPQQLKVPTPHWPRLVAARAASAAAQYEEGLVRINLDLLFQ